MKEKLSVYLVSERAKDEISSKCKAIGIILSALYGSDTLLYSRAIERIDILLNNIISEIKSDDETAE